MTDQQLLQAIGQVVEAKMEPMRQDLHALKEDIRGLKDDIQTLKEDVQELADDVQTLKDDVRGLDKRVVDLEDKTTGVRVYIDTGLRQTLSLLLEGQQALWDRFVPQEKYNTLESRTEILELAIKHHSQEIRELKRA